MVSKLAGVTRHGKSIPLKVWATSRQKLKAAVFAYSRQDTIGGRNVNDDLCMCVLMRPTFDSR